MQSQRQASSSSSSTSSPHIHDARSGRACDKCRINKVRCLVVDVSDENRCKRCQDRNLACTYSASAPVDPRAIKRKRQESSYAYSYSNNPPNPLQSGTSNNNNNNNINNNINNNNNNNNKINVKPLDPRLLGSTSVSACILSSIMRYSHVSHIEQGLAKMDEKYSLVRRPFLGDRDRDYSYNGLRYVLVARNPERVGLGFHPNFDGPREGQGGQRRRRKRRKVQVGEVLMDVKAFSLDGDYERLGGRYGVAGLRDRLYSIYRETILPVFPVLSTSELDHLHTGHPTHSNSPSTLPPLTELVICTLVSSSRSIPNGIYEELVYALNSTLEGGGEGLKLLSISTMGHLQVLLLLTMSQELQGEATNHSGSVLFLRVGVALRMAQDLGLHRDLSENELPREDFLRRRRIWRACVITDKLISLSHGQPSMACSRDCDNTVVCLADPQISVHQSIFTVCHLIGRLSFTLYSPAGPQAADPVELALLRGEILAWPQVLHNGEQYEPARLLYIPLLFLLQYPYLTGPAITPEWQQLVHHSRLSLDWLQRRGSSLLDIWWFASLGLVYSALAEFHNAMLHRDPVSLQSLAKAATIACDWADAMSLGDVSESEKFRYKCWTLIDFLHQIAASQTVAVATEGMQGGSSLDPISASLIQPAAYHTGGTAFEQSEPDFGEALSPQSFVDLMAFLTEGLF